MKYLHDEHYYNSYYARVAGIKLKELNTLEKNLLEEIEYKLFVTHEEYIKEYETLYINKYPILQILTRDNNKENKLK